MDGYFSAGAAGGCIVFENNGTTKSVRVFVSREIAPYRRLKLITKVLCALMITVNSLNTIGVEYRNPSVLNVLINEANGDRKQLILTNFQKVIFFDAQRYQYFTYGNRIIRINKQLSELEIYKHDTWAMGSMIAQMVHSNVKLPNSDAEITMVSAEEREAYKAHIALLRWLIDTLYTAAHTGTPKLQGIINTKDFETLWTA
ncbi:hypothetical protein BDF22DRAFT_776493 [Syncephalis plumigaleata]|nr:hypothetical protein BDF22DRAFT_776493 [Syncephalis plumigaleata]